MTYDSDKLTGRYNEWYDNGKVRKIIDYDGGKKNGKYKEFRINGTKISFGQMISDLMDGQWEYFYQDGKREMKVDFSKGQIQSFVAYHDNGKKKKELKND